MPAAHSRPTVVLQLIKGGDARRCRHELPYDRPVRIGRDRDCDVVLEDLRCSRVHAVIRHHPEDGTWWLSDQNSSNGTFVNGSKVRETQLGFGADIRIGSVELRFLQATDNGTAGLANTTTETIVKGVPVGSRSVGAPLDESQLVVLHKMTLALLRCQAPEEVIQAGLDTLLRHTEATVVGFLWGNEKGELRPHTMIPSQPEQFRLSQMLTDKVVKEHRAVWVEGQTKSDTGALDHFEDAICVPLLDGQTVIGAIHLYTRTLHYSERDFSLAVAVGDTMGTALVNTRRHAQLAATHERLREKHANFDELLGESKPMQTLKSSILKIAQASGCVLVRGESGSGKELVAQAVHRQGQRADRPMLSVNCAAIPRDLMESQLFGHKKGAFTGAEQDHDGWFRQADTGTLFLDEVGELTLEGQAKLLRILEGHPFLPVGGTKEVQVDVRVIAATNRDLGEFVREGKFREDLYYRLSVFELVIPPLRDRGDDIGLLIDFFLEHLRLQHGRPSLQLSPKAREKMLEYRWPGNVRQLRNVIDSAVVMADDDLIVPDDLGLREVISIEQESLSIEHWERKLIKEALRRTGNHVPEAAKLLGIGRATLYRRLEDYGIDR